MLQKEEMLMNYTKEDHTFMICAYQENPYLENCICSILNQSVLGKVKLSTSTPNEYIKGLAKKYSLSLVYNSGKGDAVDNFNFAYAQADTKLVTLCHQDDYYNSLYLETVLQGVNQKKEPIIIYTDYYEDRGNKIIETNLLLTIKRIMNYPLRFSFFQGNRWVRKRILSFGNPICCPAVTFCKANISGVPFSGVWKNSFDWDAWLRLSVQRGKFIYCPGKLMAHRIWENSITTETISDGVRENEDYRILCSLWPRPIAKMIFLIYKQSQNSNDKGE